MQAVVAPLSNSSSRACQNCSKAKAKCIPSDSGDQCSRCSRLNKQCLVPPKSTRKRRSPNTVNKSTAHLEQKIESLVTLLSTQGVILPSESSEEAPVELSRQEQVEHDAIKRHDHRPAFTWIVDPPRKAHPQWETQVPLHDLHSGQPSISSAGSTPHSSTAASSAVAPSSSAQPGHLVCSTPKPSINLQVSNGDHLLTLYREYYEPEFPFIIVSPNITSHELKATRPWVFNAICCIASYENRTRQLAMSKEVIMEFAAALLLRCEKSMDMLEGLIIFNVWQYYYAPVSPQHQSATVIQLAIGLLFDLGLNTSGGFDAMSDTFRMTGETSTEMRRSFPEMRAYLSCFLLTSVVSCTLKRIDSLDYTTYLDHTCQLLTEGAEYESDLILVFAIRAQSVISSMNRRVVSGGFGPSEVKAPANFHASSAKADLNRFHTALPPKLQEHTLVRRAYHSAEVSLYEPSLNRTLFLQSLNSLRLDMLYSCLMSAKALLDHLSTIPLQVYYGLSIMTLSQIGYGLSTVSKVSTLEAPGWDPSHVRSMVPLVPYFEHFIRRLETIGTQIDNSQPVPAKISFCTGCSRAMGRIKGWYETRLEVEKAEKEREEQNGVDDVIIGDSLEYWDEAFFNFNGDWESIGDFMQP